MIILTQEHLRQATVYLYSCYRSKIFIDIGYYISGDGKVVSRYNPIGKDMHFLTIVNYRKEEINATLHSAVIDCKFDIAFLKTESIPSAWLSLTEEYDLDHPLWENAYSLCNGPRE